MTTLEADKPAAVKVAADAMKVHRAALEEACAKAVVRSTGGCQERCQEGCQERCLERCQERCPEKFLGGYPVKFFP